MRRKEEFDVKLYMSILRTAREAGVTIIPRWKCAMLMAAVTVFGNNEWWTLSPKFQCERIYIQETYHIKGGETPDEDFASLLKYYMARFEEVKDESDEYFVAIDKIVRERYGFRLKL